MCDDNNEENNFCTQKGQVWQVITKADSNRPGQNYQHQSIIQQRYSYYRNNVVRHSVGKYCTGFYAEWSMP